MLLALVLVLANRTIRGATVDDFEVPGVESQAAMDLLETSFPERSGATAMVVFHDPDGLGTDPAATTAISTTIDEVRSLDHVRSVTDPLGNPMSMSPDGSTAFAAVQYDSAVADLGQEAFDALKETAAPAEAGGVQVDFGGELPTVLAERHTGPAEMIGVIAALVILFIMFRSAYAMALPLGVAILGLLTGLSIVGLLGLLIDIPTVAPRLGTMIGLGVGIDYALFILSRHRDNLEAGMEHTESIARTNATAGQAVVVAGGTVVVAILGLQMAGIPFVAALGYSASLVVAVAVIIAITLLPALLGFAGDRVLPRSHRGARPAKPTGSAPRVGADDPSGAERAPVRSGWVRWAHWVAHHPWRSMIGATVVLVFLAIPVIDMRLGQADAGTYPASTTQRQAYDLLADGFGPGFNGPLLITVDLGDDGDAAVLEQIATGVGADPDVKAVSPAELNPAGDIALLTAIPVSEPQAEATSELVHRLRDDILPTATADSGSTALVGGPTAGFIDQSEKISSRLLWFIGTVVLLSFLLLMIVFRSILVPLKAALLNLLAIGAAYGVVVAVFQWGWGRSLIGLEEAVPIASFVPMMMRSSSDCRWTTRSSSSAESRGVPQGTQQHRQRRRGTGSHCQGDNRCRADHDQRVHRIRDQRRPGGQDDGRRPRRRGGLGRHDRPDGARALDDVSGRRRQLVAATLVGPTPAPSRSRGVVRPTDIGRLRTCLAQRCAEPARLRRSEKASMKPTTMSS
ncbi:MAG: MMPL family transporter [Microthrixaceae bacterium]